MNKPTDIKIIEYIKKNKQATTAELVDYLDISRQAVFKQLKKLVQKGQLAKIGKPPKVFYLLNKDVLKHLGQLRDYSSSVRAIKLSDKKKKVIENNYLYISPYGDIHKGVKGFFYWCIKTKQPIEKTANEYIKTLKKYNSFKDKDGFIDGMQKLKSSFKKVYLDELFYLDFYSIERFGKTKLGQILLYAKQSQNKKLIKELIQNIKPRVHKIIKQHKIDGVGFIPPTLKREVQLMHVMAKNLDIREEIVSTMKVTSDIAVPQKTLSKIKDRIENASKTIYVTDRRIYNNILLIDDAVGSGATLNETAKKIRKQNICKGRIIGLTLTGSFKGFDIISEV